jgi:hypothetical protein
MGRAAGFKPELVMVAALQVTGTYELIPPNNNYFYKVRATIYPLKKLFLQK